MSGIRGFREVFFREIILDLVVHKAVLGHKQVVVGAMVFKKLFMAAAFLDFAFIHVEDAGTVLDGGKAVGDDKGGTSFKKLVQAFL